MYTLSIAKLPASSFFSEMTRFPTTISGMPAKSRFASAGVGAT
jgi:hypothetical protein